MIFKVTLLYPYFSRILCHNISTSPIITSIIYKTLLYDECNIIQIKIKDHSVTISLNFLNYIVFKRNIDQLKFKQKQLGIYVFEFTSKYQ
jgi:hypothetical protein